MSCVTLVPTNTVRAPEDRHKPTELPVKAWLYDGNPYTLAKSIATRVKYVPDFVYFEGRDGPFTSWCPRMDVWQQPELTFKYKRGDCEDFSLLLLSELLYHGYDAELVLGDSDPTHGVGEHETNHAWVAIQFPWAEYYIEATSGEFMTPKESKYVELYRMFYREGTLYAKGPSHRCRFSQNGTVWTMRR